MILSTSRPPGVLMLLVSTLLVTSAVLVSPVLVSPARGQEAPGGLLVAPELEAVERSAPDPAHVPEVLRLPTAEVAAPTELESLRQQEDRPGVPYRNGFKRSAASPLRVAIDVDPVAWAGETAGELRLGGATGGSWLGRFVVEGAWAFRVRLHDLKLPKEARIWLYGGGVQLGPFGREMVDPNGDLWLPPAPGPEVVVEIELPDPPAPGSSDLAFTLGDVMELVEDPASVLEEPQAWTDCDVDAMCVGTPAIVDQMRESTARLSFVDGSFSYLCSGGLLNDKDDSGFRPFLLTANHCFDSQASASSLVAYFDYRSDGCNGTVPALGSVPSVSGSTLLATDPVSDFTFVELSTHPSGTTWYLGWTTTDPSFGDAMYRVSHPAGSYQRYSASAFTGVNGITCSSLPTTDFHYSQQTVGATTGGSSGSPVTQDYSGDARVVGQLFGICRFSTWDDCDYDSYNMIDGAFSTTYPFVSAWLETAGCTADAWEADDSWSIASPISPGQVQSHSLCPAGDEDWVTFTLAGSAAVHLETSGASGDTRMWLYDSGLSQVEFDDDGGTDLFSLIDRVCGVDPLPAGTYYVKVDEFGDDDAMDAYDLGYTVVQSCVNCTSDVVLANTAVSGTANYRAQNTITLGPGLVVNGTSVSLLAGQSIAIGEGTSIGGSFSAGVHPAACSL